MEIPKSASSSQGAAEDRREGGEMVVSTAVEDSETMSFTVPSSVAKPIHESRLWTLSPSSMSTATIAIPYSSLFGVGISGYFATGSMLFGSSLTEVSFVAKNVWPSFFPSRPPVKPLALHLGVQGGSRPDTFALFSTCSCADMALL